LANLRIRFTEHTTDIDRLEQDIQLVTTAPNYQDIERQQQIMLSHIKALFADASQLTDAYHDEQQFYLLGLGIALILLAIAAAIMPWWMVGRY
jgi:hypothetical protein